MKQSTLGSYIRSLRTQNHMTQVQLADQLHVTDKAVSKWERDLSYPDIALFPKLADILGVDVNDLLNECVDEGHPSRLGQIFEMSQDIRTPLHIILGCADMAANHYDDKDLVLRYLQSIRISGEYLLKSIDMGAHVIARELEQMGALTGRGSKTWHDTTVLGIIKNEKYKGNLLQGKTFTVDPISKRRLDNQGEADQYLMKDHHEPIISEETWEQAQAILQKRAGCRTNANMDPSKYREQFSRRYAFSCMIKCGFCGASLTRRNWHSGSKYNKVIWTCISSSKYGKKNCPESKGIAEEVLMSEDYEVEQKSSTESL